jgi:hypothetical protein
MVQGKYTITVGWDVEIDSGSPLEILHALKEEVQNAFTTLLEAPYEVKVALECEHCKGPITLTGMHECPALADCTCPSAGVFPTDACPHHGRGT